MIFPFKNFQSVSFPEYITINSDTEFDNPYAILVEGEISPETYCHALYSKILSIGLSESADFIDFQCERHHNPTKWLNALEKLIKVNFAQLISDDLKYQNLKFMMEIITKRQALKITNTQNTRNKRLRESMNGYTDDKIYCFKTVLAETKTMAITEEKILFLKAQIKDYKQNPPEFESNRKPKFDEQCQLEINSLFEEDELLQKAKEKKKQSPESLNKLPVNAELKTLCDFYYKLMKKKGRNGQPIYPWTIKEATEFICNSFIAMDGTPFNASSVRTYLSPSKYNSRPKSHKEIDLDE